MIVHFLERLMILRQFLLKQEASTDLGHLALIGVQDPGTGPELPGIVLVQPLRRFLRQSLDLGVSARLLLLIHPRRQLNVLSIQFLLVGWILGLLVNVIFGNVERNDVLIVRSLQVNAWEKVGAAL